MYSAAANHKRRNCAINLRLLATQVRATQVFFRPCSKSNSDKLKTKTPQDAVGEGCAKTLRDILAFGLSFIPKPRANAGSPSQCLPHRSG
jgi:hypothetical protein